MQKDFAANAAHELKTPLAILKTSLQVLEMDEEPAIEDYREFAGAARASIDRLAGTIDSLLALASGMPENRMEETADPLGADAYKI